MSTLYTKTAQYSIAAAALVMLATAAPVLAAKKVKAQTIPTITASKPAPTPAPAATPAAATTTNNDQTPAATPAPASDPAATPAPVTTTTPDPSPAPKASDDTKSNNQTASDDKSDAAVVQLISSPTPAPANTTQDSQQPQADATPAATAPAESAPAPTPSPIASFFTKVESAVTSAKTKLFPKKAVVTPAATSTATTTAVAYVTPTGIATLFGGSALSGNIYESNDFTQSDTYKLLALSLVLAAAGLFLTNTKVFSRTYKGLADAIIIGGEPRATRSRA